MTVIDDSDLSQRLRALRAAPPENGFEARLAQRLRESRRDSRQEGTPQTMAPAAARSPGRVIIGPWLRRHPVRLVGAAGLLLAGAAAAMEGGVVEWVQTHVSVLAVAARAAVSLPEPSSSAARAERRREPRLSEATTAPALSLPREADEGAAAEPPTNEAASGVAPNRIGVNADGASMSDPLADGPRAREAAQPGRAQRVSADGSRLARERRENPPVASEHAQPRPGAELPVVPRLAIEPPGLERMQGAERVELRREHEGSGAGREPGRELERIRDIARARRDRADAERPRLLERRRERRERGGGSESEHARGEHRGNSSEHGRGERSGR
jgi:hypothetical protein